MLELDAGRIVADATFNQLVAQSADALPFDEAQTLWLVDVCGLSYAEAADQMATTHTEVTFLVRQARGRVRTDLLSNPSVG